MAPSPAAEHITILGAGAWGSTLAHTIAEQGQRVRLWDRSHQAVSRLALEGHPFGIPELRLSSQVKLQTELEGALIEATILVIVVPSHAVADLSRVLASAMNRMTNPPRPAIVLASKGLDPERLTPLTTIVREAFPHLGLAVLSGPCIAREVALGMPTTIVVASEDGKLSQRLRNVFNGPKLRIYSQGDVVGVELGGAMKNIIAIAAGISDGLGYGANSKSALMTRGLVEMARLATALGARPETIYGLTGLGDLATTCFSPHSRNRTFGELLGKGIAPDQAQEQIGMVVEGIRTARSASTLGRQYRLDLPVTEAVVKILDGQWRPDQAVAELMRREPKDEVLAAAVTS